DKRYLVLKDLVRDKENLAYNKTCQSTQTSTSKSSESENAPKSVTLPPQGSQQTKSDLANGSALHYAAKFGNLNCMKLLITQYHANVNARSRYNQLFKADRTLMDFSGYFPYMLLEDNLRTEYELKVFKTSNASHDPSINSKVVSNKKGVAHIDSVGEFKRPTIFPVLSRRFENFKRPVVIQQQTYLNRTSTLKPINQNSDYSTLRRPSVFEGILKTAADAAQNWNNNKNNNDTPNGKLSSSESSEEQNNDNPNFSKPLSTSETLTSLTDPHRRLVQRLDSMISLRRGQNSLSTLANDNRVAEIGTFDSSCSLDNGDNFSTVNCHNRKSNTLDYHRFPLPMGHSSKNSSQPTTDPYTLKLLLSLLPPLSSTSSLSSSLKTGDGSFDESKSKKHHTFTSFHKHLNRKLHRSLSNSSSATSSSITAIHAKQHRSCKRSHEFYSLPHRYHSSSASSFLNGGSGEEGYHKSLSATALLAETDVRQLLTSKVTTVIKRKASTVSQHSNLS
ncbi:ankyrin repeat domain-containing SOWAHB-like, partial [Schistosoma japonicum]